MSLMEAVESVAQSTCEMLGMDWDNIDDAQRQRFLAHSFNWYESINRAVVAGREESIEALEDLLTSDTIFKNRVPGVMESLQHLRSVLESSNEEPLVLVPDVVPDKLTEPDPYAGIEAGYRNPYDDPGAARCDEMHHTGYSCTRPEHPPTWVHFDADPEIDPAIVHAVWVHGSEFLLTVRAETLEQGE